MRTFISSVLLVILATIGVLFIIESDSELREKRNNKYFQDIAESVEYYHNSDIDQCFALMSRSRNTAAIEVDCEKIHGKFVYTTVSSGQKE